jgi:hypothetical protein
MPNEKSWADGLRSCEGRHDSNNDRVSNCVSDRIENRVIVACRR